jgi:hypothetical protein
LSRLSSAPENASGYALPITQLTKSPPGPEAKVDIVLFISLSSLAANFVQASVLLPPGTRNSHRIAVHSFRTLSGDLATITHNTMAMAPSIERSPNSRSVVETSTGVLCRVEGRCSRVRLQSMRQASSCQASPSTLRLRKPCLLIGGRPSCIRKACDRRLPSSKRAVSI